MRKVDRNRDSSSRHGRQKVTNAVDLNSEGKSDDSVRPRTAKDSSNAGKNQPVESEKSEESIARNGDGFPREVEEEDMTPSEDSREHRSGWSDAGGSEDRGRVQPGTDERAAAERDAHLPTSRGGRKGVGDKEESPSLRSARDRDR